MRLQFLNARQGDAIWVTWGQGRQLLVDMGTGGTGRAIADRFRALDEGQRAFELLVVTHVDTDHIGGVLTGLVDLPEPIPGLAFADVWFNGWDHLHGRVPEDRRPALEPMGGVQGELLSTFLRSHAWNTAFGRKAVVRTEDVLPRVELPDGLSLTVVAPVQERLTDLIDGWRDDVEHALDTGRLDNDEVSPGLERMGPSTPPLLEARIDLDLLAETPWSPDPSRANAASISLLVEHEGHRVLLAGDATSAELVAGLALVDEGRPVCLDAFKLPHHGSQNNIDDALVAAVDCPLWVFSSDGTTFRHPDAVAIARILRRERPVTRLAFNVPSTFNGWWDNPSWRGLFGYSVVYGDAVDGLTLGPESFALSGVEC